MRASKLLLLLVWLAWPGLAAQTAPFKVIKVLPQHLDREGRHALSPSLFDRDAYQARLRQHPDQRSGLRFAIQWKAPKLVPLKLQLDLRGAHGLEPTTVLLEQSVQRRGLFSPWSFFTLAGEDYKKFGEVAAWRATLWSGNQLVAEQKSFLW